MRKYLLKQSLYLGAAMMAGVLSSNTAYAAGGQNFSQIAENITVSMASLPGLLSGVSYMVGTLLGALGILKLKDHVENPSQTPLKDGAVRLAAGGGLFALPIVYEAMFETIGEGDTVIVPKLNEVELGTI